MFEGHINVNGKKVPRTLLGTSPFIGAAQFGHRARLYQLDLYNKPENILKIIKRSYELGITGIQIVPYEPVVCAIEQAIDEGCKFNLVGTVRQDCEDEDIKLFAELGASTMLLHGAITDTLDFDFIANKLASIKEKNANPGLVTHRPFNTTEKLIKSDILDLFDIYMVPVNKLGYLMDCEGFMEKDRQRFRELITKLDKTIIAKKILAAGVLKPDEAFDYLKTLDYVDIATIGIASVAEAEESFKLLADG